MREIFNLDSSYRIKSFEMATGINTPYEEKVKQKKEEQIEFYKKSCIKNGEEIVLIFEENSIVEGDVEYKNEIIQSGNLQSVKVYIISKKQI